MNLPVHTINASLSTMWAINKFSNFNDFFVIAKESGFQFIELNHQVDSRMLSQVKLDHNQFTSVHEPCPADISTKELVNRDWLISSTDEDSRQQGIKSVKNSIDLAKKLNARTVVIHCGNVSADVDDELTLRTFFKSGDTSSTYYLNAKEAAIINRSRLAQPRLNAVKVSLLELIDYAKEANVKLGLENRYHYMDIPIISEMEELLALSDPSTLGFIYDVGHAQALDRLGFFPHQEWLDRFSARMFGAHMHDIRGLSDHLAPGLGDINYRSIAPSIPADAFRTLELQPANTLDQVKQGLRHLIDTGCIL